MSQSATASPRSTSNTTSVNSGVRRVRALENQKSASRSGMQIAPSTQWITSRPTTGRSAVAYAPMRGATNAGIPFTPEPEPLVVDGALDMAAKRAPGAEAGKGSGKCGRVQSGRRFLKVLMRAWSRRLTSLTRAAKGAAW
jgi:hypothetical protein